MRTTLGGRHSSGTAVNESPDVFDAPNACLSKFHWLWRVTSGDPGVPQGPTDWDDARRPTLRIGDQISYAQESRFRKNRSGKGFVCGC